MTTDSEANPEQAKLWNGPGARSWIMAQTVLDQAFRGFETLLAEAAVSAGARAVLDIGCGTGATTRAIARALGPGSRTLGLDISAPMIARATELAGAEGSASQFHAGDAQTHAFEPAAFDLIVSRFGVMFFSDPVAAFANLRRAARPGGTLTMISWRSMTENPFMTVAERAAAPFLPDLPPRPAGGPGQFAFADQHHVHGILEEAGWKDAASEVLDMPCAFPLSSLDTYLGLMGPVGQMLAKADEVLQRQVIGAIRTAFDDYVEGPDIRFTGACWLTRAEA